jgi:predicted MFS family arabinose efflux permease
MGTKTALPLGKTALPLGGLLALSTAAAVTLLTELFPAGVLPQMSESLHTSQGQIGFLAGGYALAGTVAAIPFTTITRGLPRRPLLMILIGGLAVANLATALSTSYSLTLLVRLVAGLVNGALWSMLGSYAARTVTAEQRGRAIAITLGGITVALSVGVPAATALAGWIGWRGTFGVLAAAPIALLGWIRATLPAIGGEPAAGRTSFLHVVRLPGVRVILAVNGLLILGHQAMYTYIAPFSHRSGFDHTSLVLFVFGASAVAGIWMSGALVDRHLRGALLGATGVVAAAILILAVGGRNPVVLIVGVALWGGAFGGAPTLLLTALIGAAGPRNGDVASSTQTTVYNAAIAGGSLLGGVVLDASGPGAVPWLALPLVAAAFAVLTVRSSPHRSASLWPRSKSLPGWQ